MDLILAAKNGNFEWAFSLLQEGYTCDIRDKDNATPLYWSACHGHETLCGILIQAGCDVNARVKWGSTPLHAAADRGHINCVVILIESGADVNKQNSRGDTALHISAYRGFLDVTKKLLTSGADVTLRNEKCKTPEEEAMEGGHNDVAECIVQFVAGPSLTRPSTSTQRQRAKTPDRLPPPYSAVTSDMSWRLGDPTRETTPCRPPNILRISQSVDSSNVSTDSREDSFQGTCSSSDSDAREESLTDKYRCMEEKGPPPVLRRSFSVGGHDVTKKKNEDQLIEYTDYDPRTQRTFSCENVHTNTGQSLLRNDAPRTRFSVQEGCMPYNYGQNTIRQYDILYDNRMVSEALTSNGRRLATESPDNSSDVTHNILTSPSRFVLRPLRASTGSVQENVSGENLDDFNKRLQNQLIDSYKQVDKLTKENECLKGKCSTILRLLTDTERTCAEKMRENTALKSEFERNGIRLEELEAELGQLALCSESRDGCEGVVEFLRKLDQKFEEKEIMAFKETLRETVRERLLTSGSPTSQWKPEAEWVPGTDYVILGDGPIKIKEYTNLSHLATSMAFLIKLLKTSQRLLLKVFLYWRVRSDSPRPCTPIELDVLRAMTAEPYIDKVLHSFESSVDRFKRFIPESTAETALRSSLELCRRTTFIVTPFYTLSWSSLEHLCCKGDSGLFSYGYFPTFLLQVIYMTSSALCRLHACAIVHGNISETSVMFDSVLRPIFVDLDDAKLNHTFTSGSRTIDVNISHEMQTQEAYANDIRRLGRMFSSMINVIKTSASSIGSRDNHVMKSLDQLTRHMTEDTQPNIESVKKRVGFLLFKQEADKLETPRDCDVYIRASLMRLLHVNRPVFSAPTDTANTFSSANIKESIRMLRAEVEADFLCSINAQELWDLKML